MSKIAFIGAGSLGFTRGLIRDLLTFPLLQDATLALTDTDPERLDFAYRSAARIIQPGNHPARVQATLDRAEALQGADFVLVTIRVGSTAAQSPSAAVPPFPGLAPAPCFGPPPAI